MKAAVLKDAGKLVLEQVPMPEADDDYMVIEVKACGICGSDIRYYKGDNPWALHTLGKNLPNPPNIILGHEWGGIVKEVKNPEYRRLLGKRIAIMAFDTCKTCPSCRLGNPNLCEQTLHIGHGAGWGEMDYYPGGMAEYCRIWNTHACELPDSMTFEEATLLDPLAVAIHAITLSGIQPGDDVVVFGTGAIGLSITQAVRAFGANRVICTDLYPAALELARELGADEAVDTSRETVEEAMGRLNLTKAGVVFDTVGKSATQRTALSVLADGGTLVNLVANMEKSAYCLSQLAGGKKIVASANNKMEDFLLAIRLIENGTVQAKRMITHRYSLDEVQKGFDLMLHKEREKVMKVVITP